MPRLLAALLSCCLGLAGLRAQSPDVRDNPAPTDHQVLVDATTADLNAAVAAGFRIVDLEVRSTTPTFSATLVRNSGSYAAGWWWYTSLTASQLGTALTQNQARLIDLEPYDNGSGSLRFACVMVDNTGANAKAWWWVYQSTTASIGSTLAANNARLVDLDEYTVGGQSYRSAVMVANTGADQRAWWWYTDVDAAQLSGFLSQNQARLYDLERRSNGRFDAVLVRDPQPVQWWWWTGLQSQAQVDAVLANHGARAIDVETYTVQSGLFLLRRYAVVAINTSNALTTEIGNAMRAASDGTVGCWLEDLATPASGAKLASLNPDAVFEPASTMKTVHHVHAVRQVSLGAVAYTTLVPVLSGANGSCPTGTGIASNLPLRMVLEGMMQQSDNNRTEAVAQYFGVASILNTAAALGMASTDLNHVLGCGAEALLAPNTITLRDLSRLHRQVANGFLGAERLAFYEMMATSGYRSRLEAEVDAVAPGLGLQPAAVQLFKDLCRIHGKPGSYTYFSGSSTLIARAHFGWMSLPFLGGGAVNAREFTFGAFVNGGSSAGGADVAIDAALPLLLRDQVRAALQTWAVTPAQAVAFGAGCGWPVPAALTAGALPAIGGTATFLLQNGRPNGLALLVYGTSSTSANGIPLPHPLQQYGAAVGCVALVDVLATETRFTYSGGSVTTSLAIPGDPGLVGVQLLTQYWSFATGTPFLTSNALRIRIGT